MTRNFICGIGLLSMLSGCACGPERWAELLETQARCGMSPQEVEKLSGQKVVKLDVPSQRGTHMIGAEKEATEVWFVFKDDKLQAVQLAWMYRLKRMAYAQKAELCTSPFAAPSQ
jgi:hypothetical protein